MTPTGRLETGSRQGYEDLLARFRAGLREFYVEGQNLAIEYRFAAGKFDQLPQLAQDLARRGVRRHDLDRDGILKASNPEEIDIAFADLARQTPGSLIVSTDGYLFSRRDQIIALAARHKVPTIYDRRSYAATGGLVSHGSDLAGAYRQIGVYAARILKGEKAADLPVVQPTKFELVLNLKTAKDRGNDLPAQVLALADEVIE